MHLGKAISSLSQDPVFIVGFPRSGTTLLQSLIATQQGFYSFPETHFFCSNRIRAAVNEHGYIGIETLDSVLSAIRDHTELEFSPDEGTEIRELARNGELSEKFLFEAVVVSFLLRQVDHAGLTGIRWVEKTPAHIFHLDKLHCMYQNAKFIEIIRSPLDAIYSWKKNFPDGDQYSSAALAYRWKDSLHAFERFRHLCPDNTLSVRYEDLGRNTRQEFIRICDFLVLHPDLDLLKNSKEEANKVVLRKETWKLRNTTHSPGGFSTVYNWPMGKRLKVQYILRDEMPGLKYKTGNFMAQCMYNLFFDQVRYFSRFKILNPLKPSIKRLLQYTRIS